MLTTSEIIKKYNLLANKNLGQNFLTNNELLDKIVRVAGDLSNSEVFEIGIGPAGLTTAILRQNPKKLITIDLDERCVDIANLEIKPYYSNLYPILGDALHINENELFTGKFKIIANLPYNIGTTLLFKWLENYIEKIESFTLLLQKEVVDRIIAKQDTKDYGRVSVLSQYLCNVKKEFDIKPTAFIPQPKVISSVISLIPKKDIKIENIQKISELSKVLFAQKRKTILNNFKNSNYTNYNEVLEKLHINEKLRAENLSIEDFEKISENLLKTN